MARIELRGISKRFGHVQALASVDLVVEEGEFVSLLGPSGCGKTTTLRIVAGLESPTMGTVRIGDRDVTRLPPGERDIGMVFQLYALYPYLSARENIAFPLKARRVSPDAAAKRVGEVAAMLGIERLLDRYPSALHPADGQRVALAKAIVRDPAVFLFDEPLSHLDAHMRAAMRAELKHLHDQVGKTMLFVTHDQIEAMALSDRIAVMRQGEIVQIGTPDEVFHAPSEEYVAGFVGSPRINLVDAEIVADEGSRRLRIGDGALAMETGTPGPVRVGIRPRYVTLKPSEGSDGLPGVVRLVEPMGRETQYHVDVGAGATLRCLVRYGAPWTIDDAVRVVPDPARLLFFDRQTGRALP
ncbi:ABC transporter ATP-binding protein [Candidatus Poribacteria bacterium]|nr:ABC transporter ATP-binding protein [Candidatus Poribacteria bacterium]